MARRHETYGKYGHPDLTGATLTLYSKHHKTRTVEVTQRLPDANPGTARAQQFQNPVCQPQPET
jgi:hypothetical protein